MKTSLVIFSFVLTNTFAFDLSGILSKKIDVETVPEATNAIDVLLWRQSVCVEPRESFSVCVDNIRRLSSEKNSSAVVSEIITPQVIENLRIGNIEKSASLGAENFAQQEDWIYNLQSNNPEGKFRGQNKGRYIVLSTVPPVQKKPGIYNIKIVNSSVTATLALTNCLTEFTVPLCNAEGKTKGQVDDNITEPEDTLEATAEDREETDNILRPGRTLFSGDKTEPSQFLGELVKHIIFKPGMIEMIPPKIIQEIADHPKITEALVIAATEEPVTTPASFLTYENPQLIATINKPWFNWGKSKRHVSKVVESKKALIEKIQNVIHGPSVVVTNERPQLDHVLVVEPTSKPGLFHYLWKPHFDIFQKKNFSFIKGKSVDVAETAGHQDAMERSMYSINIPDREQLVDILYKPENDILRKPILDFVRPLISVENHEEQTAEPTSAPGIFGGLFKNPTMPQDPEITPDTVKNLRFGFPFFPQPTNPPLIIERPGAKPLLVEKPIYIEEKPIKPSIFDYFSKPTEKPLLNVDHAVIKEPVFVFEKPAAPSGFFSSIFGYQKPSIFSEWLSFSHKIPGSTSTTSTTEATAIEAAIEADDSDATNAPVTEESPSTESSTGDEATSDEADIPEATTTQEESAVPEDSQQDTDDSIKFDNSTNHQEQTKNLQGFDVRVKSILDEEVPSDTLGDPAQSVSSNIAEVAENIAEDIAQVPVEETKVITDALDAYEAENSPAAETALQGIADAAESITGNIEDARDLIDAEENIEYDA